MPKLYPKIMNSLCLGEVHSAQQRPLRAFIELPSSLIMINTNKKKCTNINLYIYYLPSHIPGVYGSTLDYLPPKKISMKLYLQ